MPMDELALAEIGQIAVPVRDLTRAVMFYRDTLRMPFLFQAPPGLAFFDCSGVRLMLDAAAPQLERHSSVLYFRVGSIESAYETLRARGVTFDDAPHIVHRDADHVLWMSFFRDPEQNLLALMSEVPTSRLDREPSGR